MNLIKILILGVIALGVFACSDDSSRRIPPPEISSAAFGDGEVGMDYQTVELTANGGQAPLAWTVTSGALPDGVTLSTGGTIAGTPTAAGTFAAEISVTDAANRSDTIAVNILIIEAAPQINSATLADVEVNTQMQAVTLTAEGGTQPLSWSAANLPPGLSLSAGGELSGTPTTVNSTTFTVMTTDDRNRTDSLQISLIVYAPAPTITTTSLPDGRKAAVYPNTNIAVQDGSTPLDFTITGLPPGLTNTLAEISGTPTDYAATAYAVSVTVTDARGRSAQTDLTLQIGPPEFGYIITARDVNNNGEPDEIFTHTFNNDTGRLVEAQTDYADAYASSQPNAYTWEFLYNGAGRMFAMERRNASGVINYRRTFVHDAVGNIIRQETDSQDANGDPGADGAQDVIEEWFRNTDLDVIVWRLDSDNDGTWDRHTQYNYHLPGYFQDESRDTDGDGQFDYYKRWVFTNPTDTRESQITIDSNADGFYETNYTFNWVDNPDGTVTRLWSGVNFLETQDIVRAGLDHLERRRFITYLGRDNGLDGDVESLIRRTFNAADQETMWERDVNGDGDIDRRIERDFDTEGKITAFRNYVGNPDPNLTYVTEYVDYLLPHDARFDHNGIFPDANNL